MVFTQEVLDIVIDQQPQHEQIALLGRKALAGANEVIIDTRSCEGYDIVMAKAAHPDGSVVSEAVPRVFTVPRDL
jgi:hypothetical protein